MNTRSRRPSPAMVVACIALSVALSGVGYAAVTLPRNSVGTPQLKNNAVNSAKVRNNAIKGADVDEATLGQVPSAGTAGTANTATSASTANTANSAGTANTANSASTANTANTATTAANATNAANADLLDSLNSTEFLRSTGKAADAERLDNLDSSSFLRTTGKASDSFSADNADALGGLPAGEYVRARRIVYRPGAPGTAVTEALNFGGLILRLSCQDDGGTRRLGVEPRSQHDNSVIGSDRFFNTDLDSGEFGTGASDIIPTGETIHSGEITYLPGVQPHMITVTYTAARTVGSGACHFYGVAYLSNT